MTDDELHDAILADAPAAGNPGPQAIALGFPLVAGDSLSMKSYHNSGNAEVILGAVTGDTTSLEIVEVLSW